MLFILTPEYRRSVSDTQKAIILILPLRLPALLSAAHFPLFEVQTLE